MARTVIKIGICLGALWASSLSVLGAYAQEAAPAAPAAPAPAAGAEAPAAPAAPTALPTPAMTGPLSANTSPMSFDLGGLLGKMYVTGAVSGLAMWQDNVEPGDRSIQADLSNGQVFVQKTDGVLQYFAELGAYSIPDLGLQYAPFTNAKNAFTNLWGAAPVAFLKLAPSDTFSVQAGKLPTLIGAEYAFTFENMNIERGLLWNQEPAISRGVQANLTTGPVAWSVSVNDGAYSNTYNWVSGLATWTIDPANTLAFAGGANTDKTKTSTFATPLAVNNEEVFNVIYTYNMAPWTITPYFQYTAVPVNKALGIAQEADTYGFALLGAYAFGDSGFSLPVRFEYISSSGTLKGGAPSLLYGPGSDAWSITVTPTYQKGIFFARAEFSFVEASGTTPGFALGPKFDSTSQSRLMFETGVLF